MTTPAHQSFVAYVQDQLSSLDGLAVRPMFGGHGLSLHNTFFGLAYDGRLYFKTQPATVGRYEAAGMEPFQPPKGATMRSYYEVPADVLDDRAELAAWAEEAAGL